MAAIKDMKPVALASALVLFAIVAVNLSLTADPLVSCETPAPFHRRPQPPRASCIWQFVEYSPSSYELYRTQNIERLQDEVCMRSNLQRAQVQQWGHRADRWPTSIFSYFTFRNNCTGEISTDFIEPLAGLMRSPLYCLLGEEYLVSKDYLVVSWNVSKKVLGRAFFFDLGASLYKSGSGGASQSWFQDMYAARGVQWDSIFAWEARSQDPVLVWCQIPSHLKPVYHWFNVPVSPEPGHADNALEYIRATAHPEDFVVLKLDIDNTPVEEALVRQMMGDPELMGLVDEFYFEHHVNTEPMHRYWGTQGAPQTLADSYRIFKALRAKGVMAHAWV